ncbi:MAG: excinuclease ABC subunit C, partial [Armatimonadetes bacterium]|nr:excinuclease ABC subunit C [Armatimonadota bacterium]
MGRTALYRNQQELQRRLREVPDAPGVYRFYDARTEIVYVGKSIHLRDRVRSYFSGRPATTKLRRMRQEIVELDWEETGSELEALLLESRLIKRHQPRFNVMLRGFVPLPYVRVDREDLYPRLEITR